MVNKANEFSALIEQSNAAWTDYKSAQSLHYCYLKTVREYLKEGPAPERTLALADAQGERAEQAYAAWCAISNKMADIAKSWNDESIPAAAEA